MYDCAVSEQVYLTASKKLAGYAICIMHIFMSAQTGRQKAPPTPPPPPAVRNVSERAAPYGRCFLKHAFGTKSGSVAASSVPIERRGLWACQFLGFKQLLQVRLSLFVACVSCRRSMLAQIWVRLALESAAQDGVIVCEIRNARCSCLFAPFGCR